MPKNPTDKKSNVVKTGNLLSEIKAGKTLKKRGEATKTSSEDSPDEKNLAGRKLAESLNKQISSRYLNLPENDDEDESLKQDWSDSDSESSIGRVSSDDELTKSSSPDKRTSDPTVTSTASATAAPLSEENFQNLTKALLGRRKAVKDDSDDEKVTSSPSKGKPIKAALVPPPRDKTTSAPVPPPRDKTASAPVPPPRDKTASAPVPPPRDKTASAPVPPPRDKTASAPVPPPRDKTASAPVPPPRDKTASAPVPPPRDVAGPVSKTIISSSAASLRTRLLPQKPAAGPKHTVAEAAGPKHAAAEPKHTAAEAAGPKHVATEPKHTTAEAAGPKHAVTEPKKHTTAEATEPKHAAAEPKHTVSAAHKLDDTISEQIAKIVNDSQRLLAENHFTTLHFQKEIVDELNKDPERAAKFFAQNEEFIKAFMGLNVGQQKIRLNNLLDKKILLSSEKTKPRR